jgi:hypothetical protein
MSSDDPLARRNREPAERDPGPGWLRTRFMGAPWPRHGVVPWGERLVQSANPLLAQHAPTRRSGRRRPLNLFVTTVTTRYGLPSGGSAIESGDRPDSASRGCHATHLTDGACHLVSRAHVPESVIKFRMIVVMVDAVTRVSLRPTVASHPRPHSALKHWP